MFLFVQHVCVSKDNLEKPVLAFQHVASGDQTEVIGIGDKSCKLFSYLL